jgi:hypothetical protein
MGAMNDLMIDKMNSERRYFSRITADHWCAKNKLEEAAKKLAYEMDRRLIRESEKVNFLREFDRRIKDLNAQFPRCKPLDYTHHKGYESKWSEWWIYCNGVFHMSLIEVKPYE